MSPESTLAVKEALDKAAEYLRKHGLDNPRLNAERLLCDLINCSRIELYTNFDRPLTGDELRRFRTSLKRRASREPLEYVLGWTEFYGRRMQTDPRALIPRPETEQLVESTIELLREGSKIPGALKIIEVGTGSGAIAVTLAAEIDSAAVWASDISDRALQLARENAAANGVEDRVTLIRGNLLQPFRKLALNDADLVISNPPYVAESEFDTLAPEIREHEPKEALLAGADGLDVIRPLIAEAPACLKAGGLLAIELGYDQGPKVEQIAAATGEFDRIIIRKDYAGHDRMLFARRKSQKV